MTQETIELRKLIASEGFVLTNGQAYGKTVFLGKNDKAENWYEITDAEYGRILGEMEEQV